MNDEQLNAIEARCEAATMTLCPECGFGVEVDEDGCCTACGATAMGKAVDQLCEETRSLVAEVRRLRVENALLQVACAAALSWYGLDGDGITDPVRQQLMEALYV